VRAKARLAAVLLLGLLRRKPRPGKQQERIVERGRAEPKAELAVAALLLAAAACAVLFVVIYAIDSWGHNTQLLGLSLGTSLALISAALIVASKRLVVTEELEEEYPPLIDPGEDDRVARIFEESDSRITRRRLLTAAAAAAGAALGAALIVPAASMGPLLDTESFYYSPWRRGRRLVDEDGRPLRADEISEETFYTAYPEGVDREQIAAPLVLVRVKSDELEMPPERRDWAPQGITAYSKICTHAGCAIALYRYPKFPQDEPKPALVCPCHYSTFNPADGGSVTFGPAGRELPQLPLMIDSAGELRAAGNFSAPVGPSFWGVRTRRPSA
jgi:ubiquinol-cytochrome c reductase iron-sulfur subunit